MSISMKTSSLQFKVLALMAVAMAVALAVSVLALTRVYGSIQELDRISRDDFETQQSIAHASIAFRQQVQEWKNVLLRGRDPDALDRHWKAFLAEEKDVGTIVREARSATPHAEVRALLEKFIAAHKSAGESYRKGLEAFRENKLDPFAGDKSVSGVDRVPAGLLTDADKTAGDLGAKATHEAVKSA